jgi:hypothetical protein
MNVLICGSRDWSDAGQILAHMRAMLAKDPAAAFIVGYDPARDYPGGADRIAYRLATEHGWPVRTFPYHYDKGRAGGPSRNAQMLAEGCPDIVLAYRTRPDSRGTNSMLKLARDAGVERVIVNAFR